MAFNATAQLPITAGRGKRVRNPISEEEYARISGGRAYLINLTEKSWQVQRTFGVFQIRGCEEGEAYTVMTITGRVEATDEGNDQALLWQHEAKDIADDVAGEVNNNISAAPGVASFMGVFVSKSDTPSEKEMQKHSQKLREYQAALVRSALRFWDDPKTHREISELHRWAGRALKVTGAWLMDVGEKETCPACGAQIKGGLAKCSECSAVLDMEKMKKFFPVEYDQIRQLHNLAGRRGKQQEEARS